MSTKMIKTLALLVSAVAICNGQSACLPRSVTEVPIRVRLVATSKDLTNICSRLGGSDLAARLEEQIIDLYMPQEQSVGCQILAVRQVSCVANAIRGRERANVRLVANLTCSDTCTAFVDTRSAFEKLESEGNTLRDTMRRNLKVTTSFEDIRVVIFYFTGTKGRPFSDCVAGSLGSPQSRREVERCSCPLDCPQRCELTPETGLCKAVFPRFFHNATSRQCEMFTYGGCGGNQNNFPTLEECEQSCKVCPSEKVFQDCGTACPPTCDNKDDFLICTLQCVQGCACPGGTVLNTNDDSCVAAEDCPVQCDGGKVFQQCATACPTTCANKDELNVCLAVCQQGCACPNGTVLNEEEDTCVAADECPTVEECDGGKVFQQCATACPTTCANKDELIVCLLACQEGCVCPDGTILNEEEDTCVAADECPTVEECDGGKVFQQCATACPTTCANKDELIICLAVCQQGCACPNGTVLNEEEDTCVAADECPTVEECDGGKVFQQCATACPTTCANKDELIVCLLVCQEGCTCPDGTVLNEEEDTCVAADECPTVEECDGGKVFQQCATACPTTCANKDELIICLAVCQQGCACPNGTVLNEEEDTCVAADECPTVEECDGGKVFQQCATACPTTCANKDELIVCLLVCQQGCVCPDGTVLNEEEDTCVAADECPTVEECDGGKVFQQCATACPTTCANKDEQIVCLLACQQGCVCPDDKVLNEVGGMCVAHDECPDDE